MKTFILIIILIIPSFISLSSEDNDNTKNVKTLYLVRHSKSSHDNPDLVDFDRPLAERGINEAPMMGKILNKLGVKPDLVISSPSQRTRETVKLFGEQVPFDEKKVVWNKKVYAASSDVLKNVIYNINDKYNSVMIFGHNPSFTQCANFFQRDTVIENVPTSGIVAIEFETDSWKETKTLRGRFLFMEYPKKYREKTIGVPE